MPSRLRDRGTLREAAGRMPRPSLHREPAGVVQIARHYIRDMVYGANDGIITTFAVVAGVTGGALLALLLRLAPDAVPALF